MDDTIIKELKRLSFEDIISLIFITCSILNLMGNNNQKKYLVSNNKEYEQNANNLYIIGLILTFLIYIYFFSRNIRMYNNKDNPTNKDMVKVIGSFLLIIGVLCLLYFQVNNDDNFIGDVPIAKTVKFILISCNIFSKINIYNIMILGE